MAAAGMSRQLSVRAMLGTLAERFLFPAGSALALQPLPGHAWRRGRIPGAPGGSGGAGTGAHIRDEYFQPGIN
ncbi:hypothetical protein NDU88_000780 [Pleurodeles waltl]|uniref:Uncharacterized protein n=1 Tax=Pleurodeles waltl TaxID=8319 RepID=A0AAV7MLI8_PLEWA|nr:hypothetical protein NDU88_000780 [Pleurodeles waltl]